MSVNKAILVGNVCKDPEIKTMQSGDRVANFSLATNERWKDKQGQKQERTEFHRVVVFNQGLIKIIESYVTKGKKIYIEGQIETRKWQDSSGVDKHTTEIVLRPFKSELVLLSAAGEAPQAQTRQDAPADDLEDVIPF